ncbi:mannonate dehydratase [Halorubrum salsamenti]|uniref:mannonate dehydratase n=1 Tax=Halorubrum salsamenti TaxID=2583990 RepID=UPI0016435F1B|nr:mannonate dehydratase [Halorubrum salsamenti]
MSQYHDATEQNRPITDGDQLPLRTGLRTRTLSDDRLAFCRQIGVEDVFLDHRSPRGDVFEDEGSGDDETITIDDGVVPSVSELVQARRRAEDAGLRLMGIQSLSYNVYGKIMLDKDGKESQLDTIKRLIRNLGSADIPILGYQWNPRGVVPMRTSQTVRLRGGARGREFDIDDLDAPYESVDDLEREYTEAELWDNYEAFLEEVLPVAEEAGVQLALHPADPPTVEQLGGIPRLFRNFEAFRRAMEIVPSDNHGLKLCLGCFSEMPDADIEEVITHFGEDDDIVFVHFRDVVGTWPRFTETFLDDDQSNFDPVVAIERLREVGFDGVVVPDHVPEVVGDTEWGHRSRAHAVAYLNGILSCADDGRR